MSDSDILKDFKLILCISIESMKLIKLFDNYF